MLLLVQMGKIFLPKHMLLVHAYVMTYACMHAYVMTYACCVEIGFSLGMLEKPTTSAPTTNLRKASRHGSGRMEGNTLPA